MNKNYELNWLTNRSNWVEVNDKLIFIQLLTGDYERQYPHSILDAIRVVRDELAKANLLIDSEATCDKWTIVVLKSTWRSVQDVIKNIFCTHDFGARLLVVKLHELGWDYNPAKPEQFTKNADYVEEAANIAKDLSDWTGFNIEFCDTSIDKGYWRVCLPTDDERRRFADACERYEQARKRIASAMDNGVLLLSKEQYQRAKDAIDSIRWKRVSERNNMYVIAFGDAYTREIVNVLDAAGL